MSDIRTRLAAVRERIGQAETAWGREPGSVSLLAVSKTWPAETLSEALAAGQRCFGENYLQEALEKIAALTPEPLEPPIEWHYIGAIQSNKTRDIARHFDWVHSVDRLKIAQRLNNQRPQELSPLNICLQVNISAETSKAGADADELVELAQTISQLPRLQLRGLMAIPAPTDQFDEQRAIFRQVATLKARINQELGLALDTLSMGMSGDLEAAIAEGATIVRIGSAIFGPRHYPKA